ncbi:hypothetical protein SAMN05444161_5309 [Rhizobiales bacterium GAS191]|nr:hypothetical protein SAMN05444161_5309 [Rhizobiales bacterium GAS191]
MRDDHPFPRQLLRKRCGARTRRMVATGPDEAEPLRAVPCYNWPVKGGKRCKLHGGASTGPKTPEGKARAAASIAAMMEGRRRWVLKLKAQGQKLPSGRKPGAEWVTPRMRERREAEAAKRWATLTPGERLAEQHEERRAGALRAIEVLKERFARTGSLLG